MLEHEGLVFSVAEYRRRLDNLRRRMTERGLDAMIVNGPENITYLTGYQTTGYYYLQTLVIPAHDDPFMVTRLLEHTNVVARTWVEHSFPYEDTDVPMEKVTTVLKARGLGDKRLGYERNSYFLRAFEQDQLAEGVPDAELVDGSGLVEADRIVKSAEEIALMRRVAEVTEAGVRAALAAVRPGVTENHVAAELHRAMFEAGGEYPSCSPFVAAGERCAIGHATWEGREIKENEYVFIESAGCIQRYHTAMMRTAYVGPLTDAAQEAQEVIDRAVIAAMAAMKPGVEPKVVDEITREVISENTFGATQTTRAGYSIGIAYAPDWGEGALLSIQGDETRPLQENMVFHLIPWVQIPGEAGIGLSETVRVTPDGGISLFSLERKIVSAT